MKMNNSKYAKSFLLKQLIIFFIPALILVAVYFLHYLRRLGMMTTASFQFIFIFHELTCVLIGFGIALFTYWNSQLLKAERRWILLPNVIVLTGLYIVMTFRAFAGDVIYLNFTVKLLWGMCLLMLLWSECKKSIE